MKSFAGAFLQKISACADDPGFIKQNLDQLFLLVEVQRQHHQQLFYRILEGQEKLRMPIQLFHPEQKPKMFLMKKAPF